jgi:hypothetical protein
LIIPLIANSGLTLETIPSVVTRSARTLRPGRWPNKINFPAMKQVNKAAPKPARKLPDPAICRAEYSGFGNSFDCLVESAYGCPHAIRVIYGMVCNHPERAQIAARTKGEAHQ